MPVEKKCEVCGKVFSVPPSRADTATACSNECAVTVRAKSRERKVSCLCKNCGKQFYSPQSQAERRIYCSRTCKYSSETFLIDASARMTMENNPAWRGGETLHKEGYVLVRNTEHPFASNGYVFKHRLVMEEWLREEHPSSKFLMEIGGASYLLPGLDVHHMDGDPANNGRSNLLACTKQTHVSIHAGYGAIAGTFWPDTGRIKIDTVPPAIRQMERRRAQRQKRKLK